ncbi:MAG TPA: HAD family hydrolase [Actinomycetota bacterium]|nr:HAD family hydrolase [Actinomycetota bacterium]
MAVDGRTAFVDKDGTLLDDVPYNVDPARMRLARGAAEGVALLHEAGYRIVVVSNQSGVARGMFPEGALAAVELRLRALLLDAAGVPLTDFVYCPHHPDGSVAAYARACECRKPLPGMIEAAARRHRIDVASSWMIGDILDDVEAGRRAGCRTVLVDAGTETEWRTSRLRTPDHVVPDLAAAAHAVVGAGARAGTVTR